MKLLTTLLCDYATVREGLLHVLGGGITRLWREDVPAPLNMSVAIVVELTQDEADLPHEVHVVVRDPNRNKIAEAMGSIQINAREAKYEANEKVLFPLALPFGPAGTRRRGTHTVDISIDNREHCELKFWVLHPDEQTLPPVHLPEV